MTAIIGGRKMLSLRANRLSSTLKWPVNTQCSRYTII